MKHSSLATLTLALTGLTFSGLAVADDFVVDASGGPDADFTDLPAAVASASVGDGDRLLVLAGTYSGFSTDKALSILERGGSAEVAGTASFHDLSPGVWAMLQGVQLERLVVSNCEGTVFVRGVVCKTARISGSADVRVAGSRIVTKYTLKNGDHAVIVSGNSHAELVECFIRGGPGWSAEGDNAGDGGRGLIVEGTSIVHVALSDVYGGRGGDQFYAGWGGEAGDGGDGIYVDSGAEVLVTGTVANEIKGGRGGWCSWGWYDGGPGRGMANLGATRESGVKLHKVYNWGYLEQPTTPDPVMSVARLSGGRYRATIQGPVGANVRLHIDTEPTLASAGLLEKPAMNDSTWTEWVGQIGASGQISYEFFGCYPVGFGQRDLLTLQASTYGAGGKLLTNSGFQK